MMRQNQWLTVFYNVENLFDTINDPQVLGDEEFTPEGHKFWDNERYTQKLEHLAQAICLMESHFPAHFGLAEIENRQVLEDLIQTAPLAQRPYKIVHYDSEDTRGIDCAYVYDSSLISVLSSTKHIVHVPDEPDFRTRDILEILIEISGVEVSVFVNHWSSRREGNTETAPRRNAAAAELRQRVDELFELNPLTNILIMGDFNDTPNDESLHGILRAKGQHELQQGDLINLLIEEENNDLGTLFHDGDWMIFDQFVVSQALLQGRNGFTIEKNNAFILKHPDLLYSLPNGSQKPNSTFGGDTYYGGYSDHLPIYMTLNKKS